MKQKLPITETVITSLWPVPNFKEFLKHKKLAVHNQQNMPTRKTFLAEIRFAM